MDESAFLLRVPRLLAAAQARDGDAYDRLIYSFKHPVTWEYYGRLLRYLGRPVPQKLPKGKAKPLESFLSAARYPDMGPLAHLREVPGADSTVASALLHMDVCAYPIVDEGVIEGLRLLGEKTVWDPALRRETPAEYRRLVGLFERLKLEIHPNQVPEIHLHLHRIFQLALGELSRITDTGTAAARPSPSPAKAKAPRRATTPARRKARKGGRT